MSVSDIAEAIKGLTVGQLADLKGVLPAEVVGILSAGARSIQFPPGGATEGAREAAEAQGGPRGEGDPKGTTRRTALRKARKAFREAAGGAAKLGAYERYSALCVRFGRTPPESPDQLQGWLDSGFPDVPKE